MENRPFPAWICRSGFSNHAKGLTFVQAEAHAVYRMEHPCGVLKCFLIVLYFSKVSIRISFKPFPHQQLTEDG